MNCEKNTDIPSAKPHSIPRYLFNCRDASLLPSNFPSFSASLVTRSLTLQYRSCDHCCNMSSRSLRRFIVAVILLAAINPVRSEQPSLHSHREFKIGVLVSLTGSWNSLGQHTVAALQLANEQLQA